VESKWRGKRRRKLGGRGGEGGGGKGEGGGGWGEGGMGWGVNEKVEVEGGEGLWGGGRR